MNIKQWICSFQYKNRIVEKSILLKTIFNNLPIDKPLVVIDIGAFHGDFLQSIKWHRKIDTAILVDPIKENIEKISKRFPFAHVIEGAVTSFEGEIEFYQNTLKETSSILAFEETNLTNNIDKSTLKKINVKATTLDKIIADRKFKKIDLLKVDVQGAEMEVLKGISEENLSLVYLIVLEVSFKKIYQSSILYYEIIEYMSKRGFNLLEIESMYHSSKGELLQADIILINSCKEL